MERFENAISGPPTQADIAAARQEVQAAAQRALSALYAIAPNARRSIESAAGYAAFSPGVYLYQITQTGLSATLTISGTKFFVDPDLN